MTIQAARGSEERVFPVGIAISGNDVVRGKLLARQSDMSFSQLMRTLLRDAIKKAEAANGH